jgi:hypothetical protein
MTLVIKENITIEDVRDAKPEMIFYGANTCWWTHDPNHLTVARGNEDEIRRSAEMFRANSSTPDAPLDEYLERARKAHGRGIPTDPRGGVLFQTEDIEGFLQAAIDNQTAYGKHGLRAFIAAHNDNCFLPNGRNWCSENWDEYNTAIDEMDVAK